MTEKPKFAVLFKDLYRVVHITDFDEIFTVETYSSKEEAEEKGAEKARRYDVTAVVVEIS